MSVAGYVRGLRAFGNWLARDGLAVARALRALANPRVPRRVIEPLSDADLRHLLAAAGQRDAAVVLLLLDTGLRVSEVVGIRLGDLRRDGGIKVTGKGDAERMVPVGGTARRAVGAYLAARGPGGSDERLFLNQADQPLTTSGVSQLLRRLRRRTGVSARCNPHTFRHTFAHNYLVNGGDALSLQRILGHSCLDMVKRYVRLSDVDLAGRHRSASPADRLVARPPQTGERPAPPPPRWGGASGHGAGSGAQSRRSTGETLRWTARRSSSIEVEVAAGDLQRPRRMAQDALQAEHVAAVAQEAAGEGVAQDVRRAAHRQALAARQAPENVLKAVRGQRAAVGARNSGRRSRPGPRREVRRSA